MKRLSAALVATALLSAACGSTVQLKSQVQSGDGLTPSQQVTDGTGSTSSTGSLGTGGTTGTATGSAPIGGTTGSGTTGGSGTVVVPGSTSGTAGSGTSGTAVVPGNHDPIQIGFVTTSVGNADSLGVNVGSSYPDKSMFEALVASYNAQGGIAGHKIKPVYGATDTASNNWANQFAAVCAQFTQDNHVKAVIGYIFVFLPSFENCLTKAHVPHLYGGYQPGDLTDQSQYPTIVATGHPSVDGAGLTPLVGGLRSGLINSKTKMGVLVNSCADGDRAFNRTIEPWLQAHHVVHQSVVLDCAQGATDVSGAASAVSSAELKFAAAGDNLVFSSDVALLVFMEDAQSQGYHPQYLTGVGGAALEANAPAAQMKNLHGFGWMPAVDVNPSHQPYPRSAAQKACISRLTKAGLDPSGYNDFMAAYQACDGIELYIKAIQAGAGTAQQVADAVQAALPSFQGTGTYQGALRYTGRQHGGPATAREYGWTDSCSCTTYRGGTFPVPTP